MLLLYIAIPLLVAISSLLLIVLTKNVSLSKKEKILKVLGLVYFVFFVVRMMSIDRLQTVSLFLTEDGLATFGSERAIILTDLLRWSMGISVLLLSLSMFTKVKTLKDLVVVFALPALILNYAFFSRNMFCMLGEVNINHYLNYFFALELVAGFVLIAYLLFGYKYKLNFKEDKGKWLVIILPLLALAGMPLDFFQHIFGPTEVVVDTLEFSQHVWLFIVFIIYICCITFLKRKSYEIKYATMLVVSVSMFINFFSKYDILSLSVASLPIHICNLATALIPLALITKNQFLFSFTYFINVAGALIAIIIPEVTAGILSYKFMVFAYEHTFAFLCPVLFVALGLMPRTRKKNFKFAVASFSAYFVLAIIFNVWFFNYDTSVNYFFLNNNFLPGKIGLLGTVKSIYYMRFNIGSLTFTLYPFFYLVVYLGFGLALFIAFLLYQVLYKIEDDRRLLKESTYNEKMEYLAFVKSLEGRPITEPVKKEKDIMISFEHFAKKYKSSDVYAVKDFNLEIKEGEIFGFLGSNGAGKSTTIKSLVGILPFEEGHIYVDGYDVSKQPLECKKLIGYVPDNHAVYERLTGRQYVNYIADLFDVGTDERNKALVDLATKFNLLDAIDKPIKSYSHGMKQKITIIAALVHNPKLWVLDEPLTGLDPQSSYEVKEYMRQHASEGNTVFFSSHIIEVVEQICDRVAIIYKGQLKGVYDMKELASEGKRLVDVFMSTQKEDD